MLKKKNLLNRERTGSARQRPPKRTHGSVVADVLDDRWTCSQTVVLTYQCEGPLMWISQNAPLSHTDHYQIGQQSPSCYLKVMKSLETFELAQEHVKSWRKVPFCPEGLTSFTLPSHQKCFRSKRKLLMLRRNSALVELQPSSRIKLVYTNATTAARSAQSNVMLNLNTETGAQHHTTGKCVYWRIRIRASIH